MTFLFGLVVGLIVGAGAVLLWALHLGTKAKAQQAQNTINVASLGDVGVETAANAFMLKKILEEVDKSSLYEIRARIN
jgi:gas vesicle protein